MRISFCYHHNTTDPYLVGDEMIAKPDNHKVREELFNVVHISCPEDFMN